MYKLYQKISKLSEYKILAIAIIFTSILYLPLLNAYFQQDEWFAFGYYFTLSKHGLVGVLKEAFSPNVGHYTPLYYVCFYLLRSLFGVNYQAFFLVSYTWHILISLTVYFLVKLITQRKKYAIITTSLFLLASSASQATSWVTADTNTHGASFFGVLSLIFAVKYLTNQKKRHFLIASIIFIVISLLFKEVTIGLFLTIPVTIWLFDKKTEARFKKLMYLFIPGVTYVLLRILMLLLPHSAGTASIVTQSQTIPLLIYNTLTFPAKAFFQAFAPADFWIYIGRLIGKVLPHYWPSNTAQFNVYVYEKILEPLFIISFVLLFFYTFRKYLREHSLTSKLMIWCVLFVIANSMIYAFSPERSGVITFIDSRNLYFTCFASYLWIVLYLHEKVKSILKIYLLIAMLILVQAIFLVRDFDKLIKLGTTRKEIVSEIHRKVSKLDSDTVFLVTSDSSYFGLPQGKEIPPFQSGFGHTLLVTYTSNDPYPEAYFSASFLWPIDSEGYMSERNFKYGYFRNYGSLKDAVLKYGISLEKVHAFSWRSETESIVDITDTTREQLKIDTKK